MRTRRLLRLNQGFERLQGRVTSPFFHRPALREPLLVDCEPLSGQGEQESLKTTIPLIHRKMRARLRLRSKGDDG